MYKIIKDFFKSKPQLGYISIILFLLIVAQYIYGTRAGDDMIFHTIRLDALIKAVEDHSLFVYIDYESLWGYGYGTKLFYGDFLLIPFAYLGSYTNVATAYASLIIAMNIACLLLSFLSMRRIGLNEFSAFVFTILYTFSFYRLCNVYERDALGEAIAMTFIPLIIWGFYEIIFGDYKKWYILSFAYALVTLSHALSTLLLGIAGCVVVICNIRKFWIEKQRIAYLALAALVTCIMSAYALLPLIEQFASNEFYVQGKKAWLQHARVEEISHILRGLFSGISYIRIKNYGVGIVITLLLLTRIFLPKTKAVVSADKLALLAIFFLALMSPLYPWTIYPFSKLEVIQFSFRLYIIVVPLLCISAAIYFHLNFKTKSIFRGVVLLSVLISFQIITSANINRLYSYNTNLNDLPTHRNIFHNMGIAGAEYLPERIPDISIFKTRANDSIKIVDGDSNITAFQRKGRTISVISNNKDRSTLELPLVYYKGYKAFENEKEIDVTQSSLGLVQLDVSGNSSVSVFFGGTMIQRISPYITLLSMFLLILYIVMRQRKQQINN